MFRKFGKITIQWIALFTFCTTDLGTNHLVLVSDSIEGHVIRAHDDVENANEQLHKASVYRVSKVSQLNSTSNIVNLDSLV